MVLELDELSGQVIDACIAVRTELEPGFLESLYENALRIELRDRNIQAEFQQEINVLYAGEIVGTHKLDVVVAGQLVLELKAVRELEDIHFAQVRSYLRSNQTKTWAADQFFQHAAHCEASLVKVASSLF
jgi:GxxExxY protein